MLALLSALLSTSALATSTQQQPLTVLSSIKPIQLIATAVIGNTGSSRLLLPPSANPHHYQLKPSQLKLLQEADLFVWVGPELELFLKNVVTSRKINQLVLMDSLSISAEGHNNDHEQAHSHTHQGHEPHTAANDPHIWLDPKLAVRIAESIALRLSTQHPALAPHINQNLERFKQRVATKDSEISELLGTTQSTRIYTFHSAFGHFAEHYGVEISDSITRTPESRPGAKHLAKLSEDFKSRQAICLVKEPNFKAPYVESLTRGLEVITVTIDPLATDAENTELGYITFIESIAQGFKSCSR